ncbi:MAG: zinc-ribbon and DUF3426 domain-containing protein [Pseudomonadota bacterium]
MYTLCPKCDAVHPLNARQLATAGGSVQCARCGHIYQALDSLYDDYPDQRREPAKREEDAKPPEVGRKPAPSMPAADLSPPVVDEKPAAVRWAWAGALVVLTLATVLNLAWTFRDALPRDGALARTLHALKVPGFKPPAAFRDPTRIHLLTRDVHGHPTREGILVLSATFINLAEQGQPYPDVSVALKNPEDQIIAARRFLPADYLAAAPGDGALLAPGQQVPILLEFADPGERATGFELRFH